ncbi:uncharacterized protein BX664DRAFT_324377 [Halteromyces radiatus]|uniref:uncharacterized protein n=1 Tax=Halteromyces radiatus TaxID=101107 RepID=UPI00222042E5|nr:uncharacterized protein BX664DRAFT_324377 [Halteromyces radiatus]KAI8096608.1 hypothetical protein BX664DRAFT_324377 [Halteromyces radiatus]
MTFIPFKKDTDLSDPLSEGFSQLHLDSIKTSDKKTTWTDNDIIKLEALMNIFEKINPPDIEKKRWDWQHIGTLMNKTPGDCFVQYSWSPWTRKEYLSLFEARSTLTKWNATAIAKAMYPDNYETKLAQVRSRIQDICLQELDTIELFEGLTENYQDISDDVVIDGLVIRHQNRIKKKSSIQQKQISLDEHVQIDPTIDNHDEKDTIEHNIATKDDHLDDINSTLGKTITKKVEMLKRQQIRITQINLEWCKRCAISMIKRDYGIYFDYYEADEQQRNAIIFGKIEPSLDNMMPKVIDAFLQSDDKCGYCGRTMTFWDIGCQGADAPKAASGDHFYPRKMIFNGDTFLHFICRQCNYAKSNALDYVYRSYLRDIKLLHENESLSWHVPLDEENKLEAWLTWMNFEYGKGYKESPYLRRRDVPKLIYARDRINKVPHRWQMTARDKLYMDMVEKMGLRDPRTGALGVYDHTMQNSKRFTIIKWTWLDNPKYNKMVTDFDIEPFKTLDIQVIMKFTNDAMTIGGWEFLDDWLSNVVANTK